MTVTLMQLTDKTCRWPIGEVGSEDFCYCGHTPKDGSPYCAEHAARAYNGLSTAVPPKIFKQGRQRHAA